MKGIMKCIVKGICLRLTGDRQMSHTFRKSAVLLCCQLPTDFHNITFRLLSKVFERLVSVRLERFMERSLVLPTTQFAYRKSLCTCDALLCNSNALKCALESGLEARILQTDYSAAFEIVNHQIILYKLCSVGIGGSVLSILTQFLSHFIPWVAAQAVRWPGVPKVARSHLSRCSKSCDLQPALNCTIRGAQGVLPCVGWGVRPVNWIYRLWRHYP